IGEFKLGFSWEILCYSLFTTEGEKEEFKDQNWNLRKENSIMDDKVSLVCRRTGPSSAPPRSIDRTTVFLASCVGPPFTFHTCGRSFNKTSSLNCHRSVHSPKQINSCSTCGKSFRKPKGLHYHRHIHLGEKLFHCTLCDKTYCDTSGLSHHHCFHICIRLHSCPFCEKRFRDQSELRCHQKTHPSQEPLAGNQKHIVRIPSTKTGIPVGNKCLSGGLHLEIMHQ
ncbi:zinc finger protein 57 homolog, partial [Sorex fumeus]|uniref:zinc finger protein 57 homolog n=1 Tax=Sorex fumeus TaxID=62283 RepID=UPI0024AD83B6